MVAGPAVSPMGPRRPRPSPKGHESAPSLEWRRGPEGVIIVGNDAQRGRADMAAAEVAGSLTTPSEAAPVAEGISGEHAPAGEHVPIRESARGDRLPGLDGLRAIAVLAVVVYHADLGWLPGGFLGVDVFFVISGFLITTLLLAERERLGRIRLRAFWMRRARRLLPALFLVLAATLTLAVVLAPDEVARLRGDTLAALGYITNWYLIVRQQSYFEAMGRPSPLLHLWSLAVEEQFYVVWPLVLAAGLLLVRRRGMLVASLAGAIGSALLMGWLYQPGVDPSRVYYGTDTHATGLLLGAALALAWTPVREVLVSVAGRGGGPAELPAAAGAAVAARGPRDLPPWPEEPLRPVPARRPRSFAPTSRDLLGVAGLLVMGLCFVLLDEYQPVLYPGGFVVLDLATAAVIVAAVHARGRLGTHVLDRQPLRWIGERSYGIYLWHWPIFTLTRPNLDVALDPLPDLVLRVALTLVAAARPDGRLHVAILDVGQGDAILLAGSSGGRILVDTGPDPERLLPQLDARIPPWDRRLDLLVLTHPHEDHVGGALNTEPTGIDRQVVETHIEPVASVHLLDVRRAVRVHLVHAARGRRLADPLALHHHPLPERRLGVQEHVEHPGVLAQDVGSAPPDDHDVPRTGRLPDRLLGQFQDLAARVVGRIRIRRLPRHAEPGGQRGERKRQPVEHGRGALVLGLDVLRRERGLPGDLGDQGLVDDVQVQAVRDQPGHARPAGAELP